MRNPLAIAGSAIVALLVLVALIPELFATASPTEIVVRERLRPPGAEHFFGTDQLGRDLYSRVIHGTRISLVAGVAVVALAAAAGTLIGLVAGQLGGRVDGALMRLVDLFLAFPFLILALAIAAVLGRGISNAVLGLSLVWWAHYARLVRGQVLTLRRRPYVEAAHAVGASPARIVLRHILPGCASPLLVQSSLDVGGAILATAAMSFLGLGAAPPTPEWGALITDGRQFLLEAWWYVTFPGVAMMFAVLGFNLLGDGLRDAFDPYTRTGAR